jgi:hypothetical protein
MWASGATAVLLAEGWRPRVLIAGLYLAGALLLGAILIALAGRWRRRSGDSPPHPDTQLAHFRSLYERGAISAEEFNRLRDALLGHSPRKPAAGPPAPTEAPQGPSADGQSANGAPPEAPPPDGIRPA